MVGADRGGHRRTRGKRRDRAVERAFSLETVGGYLYGRFGRGERTIGTQRWLCRGGGESRGEIMRSPWRIRPPPPPS